MKNKIIEQSIKDTKDSFITFISAFKFKATFDLDFIELLISTIILFLPLFIIVGSILYLSFKINPLFLLLYIPAIFISIVWINFFSEINERYNLI